MRFSYLIAFIPLCIYVLPSTEGGARFAVRLVSYRNPTGKSCLKRCCDPGCGRDQCDHTFKLCLDNTGSQKDFSYCPLGQKQFNGPANANSIDFQRKTFEYRISRWTGRIQLKICVEDLDGYGPREPVDYFRLEYRHFASINVNAQSAPYTLFKIRGTRDHSPTELTFEVAVYCDGGFYGNHCGAPCPQAGCRPIVPRLACANNPCLNGGRCKDTGYGEFKCSCRSGYHGSRCQFMEDKCRSAPCQNGGICITAKTGYRCQCVAGWTGAYCTKRRRVNTCATTNPCHNGGNCIDIGFGNETSQDITFHS